MKDDEQFIAPVLRRLPALELVSPGLFRVRFCTRQCFMEMVVVTLMALGFCAFAARTTGWISFIVVPPMILGYAIFLFHLRALEKEIKIEIREGELWVEKKGRTIFGRIHEVVCVAISPEELAPGAEEISWRVYLRILPASGQEEILPLVSCSFDLRKFGRAIADVVGCEYRHAKKRAGIPTCDR